MRKRPVLRQLNFFHPDNLVWQLNAALKALYTQQNKKLLNNEKAGLLQIDFKNAFNSITRNSVLDAARKFIPSLAPFASFCYSQHSKLFFNATHIQSESRVQQGDPLGPLLLSSGFWPIIKELDDKLPNLMQNSWYLDDGIIAGTEEELCESLEILATHGNKCGLELRRDKCELWSTSCFNAVDSRIKRNSQSGMEILGSAIETPTFVASCLEKRVKKLEKVLDNLGYIEDPQCALGILRSCLGAPKLVYSLRCNTPSTESNMILEKFDHLQRTTFENILGSVISDNSWEQACLPISKTGAGVRRSLNPTGVLLV